MSFQASPHLLPALHVIKVVLDMVVFLVFHFSSQIFVLIGQNRWT
jgi:hypothetical protein